MTLVLASTSPRRRELLGQLGLGNEGFSFEQVSPDIDEAYLEGETAAEHVLRLAVGKARVGLDLCRQLPEPVVLGSDTIVVLGEEILGKPLDAADAKAMLTRLSGRTHRVMTAVAITDGKQTLTRLSETSVRFSPMSAGDIDAYVATGEPLDKAGAYGIQGLGGCFVAAIDGSYSSVVGLPLVETRELLYAMGCL
ncbi:Maf family protein [Shewanella salipaludis]|uniref:dTTP/UTP pyrophosphatase n=1 Tax=Shewanella salipaludis TaxID=2723052 RepID=A0A972JMK9_9GAMM|nr:Maf family protein [Shewanella salipaludis]NMH65226.1 septum formation inhibitor Maf [Shewanella salipaludis]